MDVLAGVEAQAQVRSVRRAAAYLLVDSPNRNGAIHGPVEVGAQFTEHFAVSQESPLLYFAVGLRVANDFLSNQNFFLSNPPCTQTHSALEFDLCRTGSSGTSAEPCASADFR